MTLLELAERVEAADLAGEREMIQAAYEALRPEEKCWPDRLYDIGGAISVAASLVPEGMGWVAGWGQTRPDEPMGGAIITPHARFAGYGTNNDSIAEGEAATPALALIAACLRASAASADIHPKDPPNEG